MFDSPGPRLFGLPPGADFGGAVVGGLLERLGDTSPEALARVTIFVNTRRMQRRLREVFDAGPARLLPRIRLITDLAQDPVHADLAPPAAPLRRRLELMQLVRGLLDAQPTLAPKSAAFDLADSLAALMDEMQGEGVAPEALESLDVSDHSAYWARSLAFLRLVQGYFDANHGAPDREARQRMVIEALVADWARTAPADPVIIAGSTGSRGATALLLAAVACLPQGAVILPGFDFDMPDAVWRQLDDALTAEDHPQARFARLMARLDMAPKDVRHWDAVPKNARNRLISLSLRPAPVTDQWAVEGPLLTDIAGACSGLTLLEAPHPRIEAEAIARRLRQAVEDGRTAALITPDRMLTRQVAAALDRWQIVPDDSAGTPLGLSPPGRLLRQVAGLFGAQVTATDLLALLKNPLSNGDDRGTHLLMTHDLELHIRRHGPPFPTATSLMDWARDDIARQAWSRWIASIFDPVPSQMPLSDWITRHAARTATLAAGPSNIGPDDAGSGRLWDEAAGRKARALIEGLREHADAGGEMTAAEYLALFEALIAGEEVRAPDNGHPQVLIWGTLEARVQSADLVILGGMNDGTWPEAPKPDPWLNRALRLSAGLLLPERRIGLSAHDYQQAVAAPEVWITRSLRSDDAETVPSRWVNRLENLLNGLPDQGGVAAWTGMKERGAKWVAAAMALSIPEAEAPRAHRPSPRPPLGVRPKELSVTQISTLIRDPYAIYARHILRLRPLDPLTRAPDAALRGTVLHKVFERFIASGDLNAETLMSMTRDVLSETCPWPTSRLVWQARMARIADRFVADERIRQGIATPLPGEQMGRLTDPDIAFTLVAKADRIDITPEGSAILYDYKTGTPPSAKQQAAFDKQLLLESAMVERGGFSKLGRISVDSAAYIGVGTRPVTVPVPLGDDLTTAQVWQEFRRLIRRWQDHGRGYTARLALEQDRFGGDYDHLSRLGEWSVTDDVTPEDVG